MTLVILVFLGGMLTILSPCILPVLPFVFARAEQPFLKSGLPLLAGMTLTFAAIATLAAVGGSWAVHINQYGRVAALVLLTGFALTLLSRRLADLFARPFVALGNRLTEGHSQRGQRLVAPHRSCNGTAVGTLRGAHPGIGFDGRRPFGAERSYHFAAVCVCRWSGGVIGRCAARRGAGVRGFEAGIGSRGMGAARVGGGGAGGGGGDCVGAR